MAVSKRLRYEVLRRDNHACRYCGASAPDVKLTVDHVVPKALGGKDEASNLVCACSGCNAGKSSSSPDAPIVDDVAQDALRWSRARSAAIADWRDSRAALKASLSSFVEAWDDWGVGRGEDRRTFPRDPGWEDTCERWLEEGLEVDDLIDLIPKAMHNKPTPRGGVIAVEKRWTYYCGVVWRTLDRIQAETAAALDAEAAVPAGGAADPTYLEAFCDGIEWAAQGIKSLSGKTCFNCGEGESCAGGTYCLHCWAIALSDGYDMCAACLRLFRPDEVDQVDPARLRCEHCNARSQSEAPASDLLEPEPF